MKKVKKFPFVTLIIILVVIGIAYFSLSKPIPETEIEVVQCIGDKSTLYVQLGCSHCRTQEEMFGDNLKYLDLVDCFYEPLRCEGVTATPTWKIKGEFYTGVQEIERLQELTGC